MVLGLSGLYGSGKSTAAELLKNEGFTIIDVDSVGHEALSKKQNQILSEFGYHILDAQTGKIDRKKLGQIVFHSPQERKKLESIVHPWMRSKVAEIVKAEEGDFVIDAALLFYMNLHHLCDAVLYVKAPVVLRFLRAVKRDNIGPVGVVKRMLGQLHLHTQLDSGNVDIYKVSNCGKRKHLRKSVHRVLQKIYSRK
ncbi:MAG: dephospho-CoA kinase [Spirochaetia bacterium]